MGERLYEPLRIICRGVPQFSGDQSGLGGRGFDWWSPGIPAPQTSVDAQWTGVEGEEQPRHHPQRVDPAEWLRVEAAIVLGALRPVPPLRVMKVDVEFALLWIDVANRPDVLDLGRVLASEGGGDASCSWSPVKGGEDQSVCLLTITLQRPVRATFAIPFSFPDMQRLLVGILQARALVLLFGAPPEGISGSEPMVDARALYELALTPSREMISIEFDRAAHTDLEGKLLRWARWDMWET
jgi:hypothetical protein